jgi:hypothetical protein
MAKCGFLVRRRLVIGTSAAIAIAVMGGYSLAQLAQGAVRSAVASDVPSSRPTTYVVEAASETLPLPDASGTLVPLDPTTAGLHTADAAFQSIKSGWVNAYADAGDAAPPMAALYGYSNSGFGEVAADGSVKLKYQNVPVWAFTIPYEKFVDMSQGGIGASASTVDHANCFFYYLVGARDDRYITSSEQCTVTNPSSPTPVPSGK